MSDKTNIEWTDATWNPITGCSVVSPGCTNCYAMKLAGTRLRNHPSRSGLMQGSKAGPVWTGEVRFNEEWLDQPLRWKKHRRIFVCAHGDLFHESVPDEWIDRVFDVMEACGSDYVNGKWKPKPWHTFQVLTKRATRMRDYMKARVAKAQEYADKFKLCPTPEMRDSPAAREAKAVAKGSYFKNIWLGVSVEDQRRADERVPVLLDTPAAVRFLSAEPLLGPINLAQSGLEVEMGDLDSPVRTNLHWVIVGGESGLGARPMHPAWARSLRDQCTAAGVAFHFKQWGEFSPDAREINIETTSMPDTCWPDGTVGPGKAEDRGGLGLPLARVGKKAAGRLLDGREWNEFPEAA
jgi:protein gp37